MFAHAFSRDWSRSIAQTSPARIAGPALVFSLGAGLFATGLILAKFAAIPTFTLNLNNWSWTTELANARLEKMSEPMAAMNVAMWKGALPLENTKQVVNSAADENITVSYAAPKRVSVKTRKPATAIVPTAPLTRDADETELKTMQQIRLDLRKTFLAALANPSFVNTQLASTADLFKKQSSKARVAPTPVVEPTEEAPIQPAIEIRPESTETPPSPRDASIARAELKALLEDDLEGQQSLLSGLADKAKIKNFNALAKMNTQQTMSIQPAVTENTLTENDVKDEAISDISEAITSIQAAPQRESVPPLRRQLEKQNLVQPVSPRIEINELKSEPIRGADPKALSIQRGREYPRKQIVSLGALTSTQAAPQVVNIQAPPPVSTQSAAPTQSQDLSEPASELRASPARALPPVTKTVAVEAFAWESPVWDATQSLLTNEQGAEGSVQGWVLTSAETHWPTLSWWPEGAPQESVPVLSSNTVKQLSVLAQRSQSQGASILMVKVPAGWRAEFSERAETPIVLGADGLPVSAKSPTTEQYYVFLNAAPGAGEVSLVSTRVGASVVAPLMPGKVTYLDMSQQREQTIKGRVYRVSSKPEVLKGVEVKVLGRDSKVAVTNGKGAFSIEGVMIAGQYPVHLETNHISTGYTHRYKVNVAKLDSAVLFRMSAREIDRLSSDLEGGVRPGEGMIMAAVGKVLERVPNALLMPAVTPLIRGTSLQAEVYTVSADNHLQDKTHLLRKGVERLMAVRVPSGPMVVHTEDKNAKTVWSELVYSSPDVVLMVAPGLN